MCEILDIYNYRRYEGDRQYEVLGVLKPDTL